MFKGYLLLFDGLGLEVIGIFELEVWIRDGVFSEVIFVINFIVEGEVIVYYIV